MPSRLQDEPRAEPEQERALPDRLAILAEASEVLASSLDYETTLQNVIGLALPLLGDFGFFDVVERGDEVRRIARAHQDPRRQAILEQTRWTRSERTDINLCGLSTGKPGFHPEIAGAWLEDVATSPEHLAVMKDLGFRSMITVPLLYRDRILGALTLFFADSGRRHTPADLTLAEELARRAAAAVENARLYQEAQSAVRAREQMLAVVSHDLRNPLQAIGTAAALLRKQLPHDEQGRSSRHVDVILRSASRMTALIRDLLDFGSIQAGQLQVQCVPQDLVALVRESVEFAQPLASEHSLRLGAELPPGELPVSCDRERILQILENLLGNAVKFTPEGGTVQVRVLPNGREVTVAVADTGPGIPQEQLAHVFEQYWRGGHRHQGVGLGLAIVKALVEAQGGRVWAESTVGEGSRFFFALPLLQPAAGEL